MRFIPKSYPYNSWQFWLIGVGLVLLVAVPRLTALNQYRIVDEADRWRWAEDFVLALNNGDLAATRVGDGYPGIVPVWAESIWVFGEAARRSLLEGGWIGDAGLGKLFHEWDRSAYLYQQRLPIVLLNTALALAIIWVTWRLFGRRVALLSGLLIALDPFYLSDSRVNRAEAVITGFMTLSILFLIYYGRKKQFRYVLLSGICGGLSFLTKIQALAILPAIALAGGWIVFADKSDGSAWSLNKERVRRLGELGIAWALIAAATWVALWPAMWVTPLETLDLVYGYATRKVGAEGVKLFFMGETFEDIDPGPIFYPFVLLMRTTPLTVLGLLAAAIVPWRWRGRTKPGAWPPTTGSAILLTYVVVYALAMTLGSHKQDRYLMPIFLALDILAALGLVFAWAWLKEKLEVGSRKYEVGDKNRTPYSLLLTSPVLKSVLFAGAFAVQLAAVLPHHPYYYSYFNPLFGGGATAVRTMRIGWGEGMDQVGAYLGAKPNAERLVVSSRFTHNMLGFPGEIITLGADGRWTKADYIVLYIQQVQRRLEPGPEFLDYFQARTPEKVITLGDLDYAWIYPIPFTTPANPQVSVIPQKATLLGYSWAADSQLRTVWQNLGLPAGQTLAARLAGSPAHTDWTACLPDPAFSRQAATPQAYVESLCAPNIAALPPGLYSVEIGLAPVSNLASAAAFIFPEGRLAAQISPAGEVAAVPEQARLEAIAAETVPPDATTLDRVFDGRIRLLGYRLNPPRPRPGDSLELTLYWQAVRELSETINLTVQLADSRSIALGRADTSLFEFSGQESEREHWFPGQVIPTRHTFPLAAELDSPLAGRIEISLANEAEVGLNPTTAAGEPLDKTVGKFTVAPPAWPATDDILPVEAGWQNGIALLGYSLSGPQPRPGEQVMVNLFWQTGQPLTDEAIIFVHLVDGQGQLVAQNDALPRQGAYPTAWWQPGDVIEDGHPLALPPELSPGAYQLLVGLYRPADGTRLPLATGGDSLSLGQLEVGR
ncbi:MAG: hypothetical protein FOGNACKC_00418 [Anaerolineae bacterium]|nr:hypothetical protein [Anaerolineae bacterium]